jgi:DNA-binding beta-propeller fold protein YncE
MPYAHYETCESTLGRGVKRSHCPKILLAMAVFIASTSSRQAWGADSPIVFERSFGPFSGVRGLAVDATGNLYVPDVLQSTISKFGPDGALVTTWVPGQSPYFLAVGPDSAIWVAVIQNGLGWSLARFAPQGDFLSTFASFDNIHNVAFDPTGNYVYIVNHYFGRIHKFRIDGTQIASWDASPFPVGIAVDRGGRVYVSLDRGSGPLKVFNPDGVLLDSFGISAGQLTIGNDGSLYTAWLDRIRDYTTSGQLLWEMPVPDAHNLFAITLDEPRQKLYAAEYSGADDKVYVFSNGPTSVTIDIKPGAFPNSIQPKSKGVIPVAIMTTAAFDATSVDIATVRFGATGTEAAPVQSSPTDLDGDGKTDLILHFATESTGIGCGCITASLTGKTLGGQKLRGADSVSTVGCK